MADDRGMTRPPRQPRSHCPSCHQTVRPTPILWGLPSHEGFAMAQRGEVVLGGCLVGELDPSHVCPNCGIRLYELPDGGFEIAWPTWSMPQILGDDGPPLH